MTTTNQMASGASTAVPAIGQKRLVIVGTTGMVGGYALRFALDNLAVKSVTSIGRKRLGKVKPNSWITGQAALSDDPLVLLENSLELTKFGNKKLGTLRER